MRIPKHNRVPALLPSVLAAASGVASVGLAVLGVVEGVEFSLAACPFIASTWIFIAISWFGR